MADVTGPISTLPGTRHVPPKGTKCDEHPDRLAVVRLQGETDSFGSEMHDLCTECLAEHNEWKKTAPPHIGTCDWCKTPDVKLRHRRDMDEGMSGRVYDVCDACVEADNERIRQELDEEDY